MTISWKTQKYGGYYANLGNGLFLGVNWSSERLPHGTPSWDVTVFGVRLKGRCLELDEAKARAERVAKQILGEAMEKLLGGAP